MELMKTSTLFLIILTVAPIIPSSDGKQTVEIVNKLPHSQYFAVHCKSKDDDLGTHYIAPGQSYRIRFEPHFWGRTLFFCGISWRGGSLVEDIYQQQRDEPRCDPLCTWEVKQEGLVGIKLGIDLQYQPVVDIVFPWK